MLSLDTPTHRRTFTLLVILFVLQVFAMKFLELALVAFGILCPSFVQTAPLTLELNNADLDSLEHLQRRANTTDTSDTRNDIVDKAACEAVTVIFARGTYVKVPLEPPYKSD